MLSIHQTLALAIGFIAFSAFQCEARVVTIKGLGSKPCREWTQAHLKRKPEAVLQEAWLDGLITAYNAYALTKTKDLAADADPRAIQSSVSKYCLMRPKENLFKAVTSRIVDLQKKSSVK